MRSLLSELSLIVPQGRKALPDLVDGHGTIRGTFLKPRLRAFSPTAR